MTKILVSIAIAGSGGGQYPLMGLSDCLRQAQDLIDSLDTDADNLGHAMFEHSENGIWAERFEGENAGLRLIIIVEGGPQES